MALDDDEVQPAISNKCRVVCDYHKARRPFRAADAARVVCYALKEGATMQEIRNLVVAKCGVGEVECDCEEELERLKDLAQALELIVEVIVLSVPVLAIARKVMKTIKLAKVIAAEKELQKVEKLLDDAGKVADKSLKATKKAIEKMLEAPPVKIVEP